jgi:hypothetical protein
MLAVPRYQKKSNDSLPVDFMCFIYKSEERVLSDIIYSYKDCRDFPADIQKELMQEVFFKAVLDMTVIKLKEMDELQKL